MLFINSLTQNPFNDFSDIEDYVSSRIIPPHPKIITPDLNYFKGILIVCSIVLLISFVSLVLEKLFYLYNIIQGVEFIKSDKLHF